MSSTSVIPLEFRMERQYRKIMNKPRKDVLILGVLVLAAAIIFYHRSQNNDIQAPPPTTPAMQEPPKQASPPNPPQAGTVAIKNETSTDPSAAKAKTPGDKPLTRNELVSATAIKDFKESTGLDINLPPGIHFQDLGIDSSSMTAIYGKTQNMDMAVVASKGNFSQEDVLNFIRSQDTGIPNLDKAYVEVPKSPKSVNSPPENGMSAGSLWTGSLSNGELVHIAVLPRKDGQGSYMVITSGQEDAVEGYDDAFEDVYKSMKALPIRP
ncbi:MAG: hypothetical protein KF789_11240 [Bdellovibrionaceae bacterium]|nr:hypothetical protein [Pseudobdellovibrionaceae bacterium]